MWSLVFSTGRELSGGLIAMFVLIMDTTNWLYQLSPTRQIGKSCYFSIERFLVIINEKLFKIHSLRLAFLKY